MLFEVKDFYKALSRIVLYHDNFSSFVSRVFIFLCLFCVILCISSNFYQSFGECGRQKTEGRETGNKLGKKMNLNDL